MKVVESTLSAAVVLNAFALFGCDSIISDQHIDVSFEDPASAELAKSVVDGEDEEIARLVKAGAPVDSVDRNNKTLLDYAARSDRKSSFAKLLSLGANPNLASQGSHTTIVHRVAVNADSEWLKMALTSGGDPNVADNTGRTPLFAAIASKNPDNLDLLLDAGADINHQDSVQQTPAVYAAGVLDYNSVLHLLKRGACVLPKDQFGKDLRATVLESIPGDPGKEAIRQQVLKLLEVAAMPAC